MKIDTYKSFEEILKIYKLVNNFENINVNHIREDLINEDYITSDTSINTAYEIIETYMKGSEKNFFNGFEMDSIDMLVAQIIYNYRYKKTKQNNDDSQTEYDLLVHTHTILENKRNLLSEHLIGTYTDYLKKLNFAIDYLRFYSAVLHSFTINSFNPNADIYTKKRYTTPISDENLERVSNYLKEISELNTRLQEQDSCNQ